MNSKGTMWLFVTIGGWLGGYIPLIWGAGYFSFSSIIFSSMGAIAGIWLAFKLTH